MIDDGSTDASLPLLYSIAANPLYPNYSVLPLSPNGGAAAARNAGVSAATGKVIAFAESDDWYLDHHLWSCLSSFIKEPSIAFTKTKIDMGTNIHPHWQTGVEDVSPLNTCLRRESFFFAGGFPTTDLFRDDMEDGHMAIILHSLYRGAKLYTHTSRYRIRQGNQLHQRMPQFTSPPGHAPMIQGDVENNEKRMAAIQEATVIAKDRLAEYQDLDMLSSIDPLSPIGRATHAQRRRRFFAPSFPVLQVDSTRLKFLVFIVSTVNVCFTVPVPAAAARACTVAGFKCNRADRGPCASSVYGQEKSFDDMGSDARRSSAEAGAGADAA
jgi:glycosyltransferase involved in cell wall biosynthesis